jgi:hypothetical protein
MLGFKLDATATEANPPVPGIAGCTTCVSGVEVAALKLESPL